MKTKKIIALFAFACFSLTAVDVMAQSDDDDAPPPMMSDFDDSDEGADSESETTDSYNDTVTIDENGTETSSDDSSDEGSFSSEPPAKERLRVYSGKHDGNNVIYDPRR